MAIQTRNTLKDNFSQGKKPTGAQFADIFDSFVHKEEDGDTSYTNDEPTTVAVGGIAKGTVLGTKTVAEVLDLMLNPYVAISGFSISTNLSGVKEKGVSVSITEVTPKWTAGSQAITSFDVYKDSARTNRIGGNTTGAKATVTAQSSSSSLSVYASLTDGKTTLNAESTVTFVDPYYTGMLAANTKPTSDAIKATTKKVESKANKTYAYTGTGYPCVAYPKSYGALKSIKDASNLDATNDFERFEVTVTCASGDVAYYAYVQKTKAEGLSNFNYTFNL